MSGKLKIFNKGPLIKPVLASAAFPGLFSPVKIKNSYYVDGGTLNNFPVESIKKKCERVIGVYVNGYDELTINDLKHSHNVVERAFKLKSVQDDIQKFAECDLIIYPNALNRFGTFNTKNIDEIFEIGYNATKKALSNYDIDTLRTPLVKSN